MVVLAIVGSLFLYICQPIKAWLGMALVRDLEEPTPWCDEWLSLI